LEILKLKADAYEWGHVDFYSRDQLLDTLEEIDKMLKELKNV